MNTPEKTPAVHADLNQRLTLTRAPQPASRKVMQTGIQPGVSVPMREIALSNGERITVYDTSGPYTTGGNRRAPGFACRAQPMD